MPERRSVQPRFGHVAGLDGLRGLAVAGVLLYHGGHLTGGYLGVDLFFTLSGFLITSLLLREVEDTGGVGLVHFWGRRARRLLPALFGLLLGIAAFATFWSAGSEERAVRGDTLATLLYVANWRAILGHAGYWDVFGTPSPLRHTWSLAIEEQFYLLWPLVVLGLAAVARRRRGSLPRLVMTVGIIGALCSYAWMAAVYTPGVDASRAYFGTDTRVGGILLGAVLAAALSIGPSPRRPVPRHHPDGPRAGRRWLDGLAVVAAAWLWWAWTTVDGQATELYWGGFFVSALAGLALIAAVVLRPQGLAGHVLSVRPLRALGIISYGLYLWHWPVFLALQLESDRLGLDGWSLFVVQVSVSLAVAWVSFIVIERPIRTQGLAGWGPGGRRWMPAAATACVLLVVVVTTVQIAPGPAERPAAADAPVPTVVPDEAPAVAVVPATGPAPRPAGRDPRLLVVGDSVGIDLADGIAADSGARMDVVNQAEWACKITPRPLPWKYDGVTSTVESDNCDPQRDGWEATLDAFDPDAVLVAFGGGAYGEAEIDGAWASPCSPEFDDYWLAQTESAIDLLSSRGAVVWVVLPPDPVLAFTPHGMVDGMRCVNEVYAKAVKARPEVARAVPLDSWVCPVPGKCRLEQDGVTLRPDGLHFQGGGRTLVSEWLAPRLFAPA